MKKIPAATAEDLLRPVWIRAVLTVAFAVLAIFWQNESLALLKYSLAAFFVLGASAVWDYVKSSVVPEKLRANLALGAALWGVSGIAAIFAPSTAAAAIIAAVGFFGMGVAELVGGLRVRAEFTPARDQVLLGGLGVLTGIGLGVGVSLDPHGVLGIAGTGVIVMAVLLLISAAGLTHDARKGSS